jgi:electron transfer flavoprotein-quinone oxidoreductase
MADDLFDAIVVGAGPSGLAAALTMAKAGLQVACLERGAYPGSKNVMGGIFYRHPLDQILPHFWESAPVERSIIEQRFWLLGSEGHVSGGVRSKQFETNSPNCWSVLRAKFDRWLAEQAEAAGVMLLTEAKVESLLMENHKVVGVHTALEDGDLRGNVVVIAEGVNSILLRDLGVHKEIKPTQVASAVKEVISLPAQTIEDRFNVAAGQGVAIELFGSFTRGAVGLGFLYSNQESVSIGLGVLVSDLQKMGLKTNDLLEELKSHPSIKPLLAGGKTEEYLAHLIPEGGLAAMPKLSGEGWVVVGDAAMLVDNVHREGSNLAVQSGLLAGQAIIESKTKNDFSAASLQGYENKLRNSFVINDLKKYQRVPHFLETSPQFFSIYPNMINDAATEMFQVDGIAKREKQKRIFSSLRKRRGLFGLLWDAIRGGLTLR